ncbi:MAG: hypothetical protein ACSLE6_00360 [Mycobacterium sp.]
MWCPSVSLAVWANAWLAGCAAPDDVVDALNDWAPRHSVTAYDAVAALRTGLPWPDIDDARAIALLQTVRSVAGTPTGAEPAVRVVIPVAGDVRGLPAGTQFQRDAITLGEALIISRYGDPSTSVGVVPEFTYDEEFPFEEHSDDLGADDPEVTAIAWTVYSLPDTPMLGQQDLGEAEYALRSAVRSAADALTALQVGYSGPDVADPRALVQQVLDAGTHHRAPENAPQRALRVLENAAHVDAIIAVSSGLMPIGTQTSSEAQLASDAIRPLAGVVRSARRAAVDAILHSAWQR